MHCYQYDPRRSEPLYRLAFMYRMRGWNESAVIYARAAAAIPYPSWSVLFTDATIYDWRIFDEVSVIESNLQNFSSAYHYAQKALTGATLDEGNRQRIIANMDWIKSRLG